MSSFDFNKVYTSGTVILLNPVEANSIFIISSVMCASLEYLFEISGDVDSEYYQELFEVITEEALVFGVVQLVMVFLSSLTQLSEQWGTMFQWGQLLMMMMAVWLTIFVLLCASQNASEREYWKTYESQRMNSSANQPDEKEKLYSRCVKKFQVSMMAYDFTQPVMFADYLAVIEKRYIVQLMDLNWKSWLSMIVTAVVNSLRAGIFDYSNSGDENLKAIPIALYIIFEGILPLIFFVSLSSTLHRRLQQYLDLGSEGMEERLAIIVANSQEPDESKHKQAAPFVKADLQDPKSFLVWQSLEVTLTLVQVSILQVVWYFSICTQTMYGNMFSQLSIGFAVAFLIISLIPGIWLWQKLSWTITLISILSSLETALDQDLVDTLGGTTAEERAEDKAELEKEMKEKARKEAEERGETVQGDEEEENDEPDVDEDGRILVRRLERARPVELVNDVDMSRIAIDRREALKAFEELEGVKL